MAPPVRNNITAIVGSTPGKNGTTTTVTHELVTMRVEPFQPTDVDTPSKVAQALGKVQQHVQETTQSARSLPQLGGTYFPGVVFTANTPQTLAHRVQGGQLVSFEVKSPRSLTSNAAVTVIEVSQNASLGRITLLAVPTTMGLTCDLQFFQRPNISRPGGS